MQPDPITNTDIYIGTSRPNDSRQAGAVHALAPDRRSTLEAVILDGYWFLVIMEASIDNLVDLNDEQFDYCKNWLAQSIAKERSPISPQNDHEEKLQKQIDGFQPVQPGLVK